MTDKKEMPAELKQSLKAEFSKEWRKELRKSIPVKERMKISRQKMSERNPEERNQDFNEVNLGLDTKAAIKEAQRCLDCANPQCVMGCPVGIDIPSFIKWIEIGDFVKSIRKMKETNSLPAICGRVCRGLHHEKGDRNSCCYRKFGKVHCRLRERKREDVYS
jgi:glutamate synthase (NADPH/NADH) small chain